MIPNKTLRFLTAFGNDRSGVFGAKLNVNRP